MKTVHSATATDQLPEFFSEKWLRSAIKKLELSSFTKEERMVYEIELAKIGSFLGALKQHERKGEKRGEKKVRELLVMNLLMQGTLTIPQIAQVAGISEEAVLKIQEKMRSVKK